MWWLDIWKFCFSPPQVNGKGGRHEKGKCKSWESEMRRWRQVNGNLIRGKSAISQRQVTDDDSTDCRTLTPSPPTSGFTASLPLTNQPRGSEDCQEQRLCLQHDVGAAKRGPFWAEPPLTAHIELNCKLPPLTSIRDTQEHFLHRWVPWSWTKFSSITFSYKCTVTPVNTSSAGGLAAVEGTDSDDLQRECQGLITPIKVSQGLDIKTLPQGNHISLIFMPQFTLTL